MSQEYLVVANFKLNPQSRKEAKKLFAAYKKAFSRYAGITTVVCPPFVYLDVLARERLGKRLLLGAQDVFYEESGSFTGEVSAEQLAEVKVSHVVVGHSERRVMGETDEDVARKTQSVLRAGMTPIVCIGESSRDDSGAYLGFLTKQIREVLTYCNEKQASQIIFAYEPLWAIGSGSKRPARPREVFEIVVHVKKVFADYYKMDSAPNIRVLYGGSVSSENVEDFLKGSPVDGFLVGRASLEAKHFITIVDKIHSFHG
jgi:triosephosphate isomerase